MGLFFEPKNSVEGNGSPMAHAVEMLLVLFAVAPQSSKFVRHINVNSLTHLVFWLGMCLPSRLGYATIFAGFEIHCCIDGYSRKIIWLHVMANNRIPEQILALYIDAVRRMECMPARQRSDRGNENCLAAAVQQHYHGETAHIYGRSVANQRIEAWWNQMYAGGLIIGLGFSNNSNHPESIMWMMTTNVDVAFSYLVT